MLDLVLTREDRSELEIAAEVLEDHQARHVALAARRVVGAPQRGSALVAFVQLASTASTSRSRVIVEPLGCSASIPANLHRCSDISPAGSHGP